MNEYNLTEHFNESFGIDSADAIILSNIDLDAIDSSIDDDIEHSYH